MDELFFFFFVNSQNVFEDPNLNLVLNLKTL